MTREESKYCEECKYCKLIEKVLTHEVHCAKRTYRFDNPVIYCKYKKLKKEKKRNAK